LYATATSRSEDVYFYCKVNKRKKVTHYMGSCKWPCFLYCNTN